MVQQPESVAEAHISQKVSVFDLFISFIVNVTHFLTCQNLSTSPRHALKNVGV
jgi:hypothetical protein